MPVARVGSLNLSYYVVGQGAPVLMIQGLCGHAADWGSIPGLLAPRFEVITFDNRGTGASDKPDEEYSLDQMADEAVAILDTLDRPTAHVVGISMGGMIAQLVALRHPQRVERLVLLSTHPGGAHAVSPTPEAMTALIPEHGLSPEELIRRSMEVITGPGFAAAHPDVIAEIVRVALSAPTPQYVFARQMMAVMESDRYDRLPGIGASTLVVHGDEDQLVPYPNGEVLARRIPGATLHTLHGCGHLAMWEQPRELSAALLGFLS